MSKYLIDYENVYIDGLKGLESLDENDEVCIFYTQNRCGMTFDLHKRLMKSKAAIKLLEVPSAPAKNPFNKTSVSNSVKNALDLQLTLYLGYLMAKGDEEVLYIISRDKDFGLDVQFCETYLEDCKTEVERYCTIQNAIDKVDEDAGLEPETTAGSEAAAAETGTASAKAEAAKDPEAEKVAAVLYTETLYNAVYNLLTAKITLEDANVVDEVCRAIKLSTDLLSLNNRLAALFRDGERVKEVYHILKPQFELLRNF